MTKEFDGFIQHARSLGLNVRDANDYVLAFLMQDARVFSYCFKYNGQSINVQYFVGHRPYQSKMSLNDFYALDAKTMKTLAERAEKVNKEFADIEAQLKELPKKHKENVNMILGC